MLGFIKSIFGSAERIVDELHVSEEEKAKLRNEFAKIQLGMHSKSVELMKAEASSDHWIVAAVRPISTLVLMSIIVADAYGWAEAPPEIYGLAEIFISVYASGRSFEKAVKVWKK